MSIPMTGVHAAQVTLPQQQPGGASAQKQEASRFDGVLADKARDVGAPGAVGPAQEVQGPKPVAGVAGVDGVARTEHPLVHGVSEVVHALEQGQRDLDRIIQEAGTGKAFSNGELLSLQASMYQYTQELDLVGKVVDKGTSGLRDVLKTQV